mgnify:CR=1 FL=1
MKTNPIGYETNYAEYEEIQLFDESDVSQSDYDSDVNEYINTTQFEEMNNSYSFIQKETKKTKNIKELQEEEYLS